MIDKHKFKIVRIFILGTIFLHVYTAKSTFENYSLTSDLEQSYSCQSSYNFLRTTLQNFINQIKIFYDHDGYRDCALTYPSFSTMPDDILLHLSSFLNPKDIINLAMTSKQPYSVFNQEYWAAKCKLYNLISPENDNINFAQIYHAEFLYQEYSNSQSTKIDKTKSLIKAAKLKHVKAIRILEKIEKKQDEERIKNEELCISAIKEAFSRPRFRF